MSPRPIGEYEPGDRFLTSIQNRVVEFRVLAWSPSHRYVQVKRDDMAIPCWVDTQTWQLPILEELVPMLSWEISDQSRGYPA